MILLIAITAAGCWDEKEIEDIGISTAMAIDRTPDGSIKVTLQILNPTNISPCSSSELPGLYYGPGSPV
ncbi:MAG: hypothetical protein QME46_04870 [Thermoanaerobacteraceae bacterium]|nr:hypothetical protein [Thermoanaerobacteraceae bacterium]